MPFDVGDFVGGAAREAAEAFREPAGVVAGYYRDALRGLPDGPPVIAIGRGIAQQACRRYADNPTGYPGPIAAGFESVCRPYLDDIGYGSPPSISLPFRGGQCPGVQYRIEFSWTTDQGNRQSLEQIVGAPLVGTYSEPGPFGATRVGYVLRNNDGSTTRFLQATVQDPNTRPNPSVRVVRREDNLPDDCGNPPPDFGAPQPPPAPGPQVEPFNPSPGIDIDIDLTIGPTGGITFNIGTGPITIDPFPGGGGDGGGDNPGIDQPGTAPSSGLPPGDIGTPAAPVETPPGGEASGCAPPNSVLVGIKINIVLAPEFASEYDPLVRRGVCYAYMGTIGNLALEPSGVALRSGQMLFAPLDNLTCWEVRANTGYVLQVIPYYRALELEEV